MEKKTLEQFIYEEHTPKTAAAYLYEIENFRSTNPRAKHYQYTDIVKHFDSLKTRYPNVSTRIRILAAIKKYYEYLYQTRQRNDHPCRHLHIKRNRHQIQTQDLFSFVELQLLFDRPNRYNNLDIRNKVVISLLIYQALTSQELVNLNVSNIDFDKGTIFIKASKKIHSRTLELDKTQWSLLDSYVNVVRPKMLTTETNRLILNKLGEPISVDGIHSIFVPLKGLFQDRPLSPDRIRMSVISHWLNDRKLPVEQVMDLSGQKWASSVMAYKKDNMDEKRDLINKFHPLK